MTNFYNVGTIVNTQGLQGEVRVVAVTDFADERFKAKTTLALFDKNDKYITDLTVKTSRRQKNFYVVKFDGLYHINDVEKFRDFTLKIAEENLTDLDENEFYYHEIIGLDVYENDQKIGVISEILQPGANDVWVVKRQGKKDLLLPYIPPVILDVNLAENRVNVDIMEGLDD